MTALEPRCERTDLPVSMCAHCRPPAPIPERATTVGQPIIARHEGRCGECDDPIREGDVIARLADGSGYACPECLR